MFNKKQLVEYQQFFGSSKLIKLFQEFRKDTAQKFLCLASSSPEDQRLIFHSLKSSSLVFGMTKFSKLCAKLEQKILDNKEILAKDIVQCHSIYNQSVLKVDHYLLQEA